MREATSDTSEASPKPKAGPLPIERHETILKGIRDEFEGYKAKHGWAEHYQADVLERYAEYDRQIAADPVQVAYDLMQAASKNPKFAAKIKSLAARTLAGHQAAAPTSATPASHGQMPGPDLDGGYSPAGLERLLAWNRQEALAEARAEMQKELGPFRTVAETFENQRKSAERQQYLDTRTQDLTAMIEALPLAKDHMDAISTAFMALPAATEADLVANAFRAYHATVDPLRDGKAKQAAMTALSTQAQANTVRPTTGKAGAPSPKAPKGFADALRDNAAAAAAR
jgi:hypothetical protein